MEDYHSSNTGYNLYWKATTDPIYLERYGGLDLEYFKKNMTDEEYQTYIDYIGRYNLEIKQSDFDIYYPN